MRAPSRTCASNGAAGSTLPYAQCAIWKSCGASALKHIILYNPKAAAPGDAKARERRRLKGWKTCCLSSGCTRIKIPICATRAVSPDTHTCNSQMAKSNRRQPHALAAEIWLISHNNNTVTATKIWSFCWIYNRNISAPEKKLFITKMGQKLSAIFQNSTLQISC